MVKDKVTVVMDELINTFDEYVVCLSFAAQGIEIQGRELAKHPFEEGHRIWIGSNIPQNTKLHARMNTAECIEKCKTNGYFSSELAKSLLCNMYSQWDEVYRHRIADITGYEAKYIECPLMGDLRKIRHCILHNKSIVPENGLKFEVLEWKLLPKEKFEVTVAMFIEFNDKVHGIGMKINAWIIPSGIKTLIPKMTKQEQKSFDGFFKKRENRVNSIEWPGLQKFLDRIGHNRNVTPK